MDVVQTSRVIFMTKTSLDVLSLRREHIWTCSVLGDCICEMKRSQDSRGSKHGNIFAVLRPLVNPVPTGN